MYGTLDSLQKAFEKKPQLAPDQLIETIENTPGNCTTPEECSAYCEEHPEECEEWLSEHPEILEVQGSL